MKNDYYDSDEFRELLSAYEQSLADGTSPYFDTDDYADIADYYLTADQPDACIQCVEGALEIYPDDVQLLTIKSGALIYTHSYKEADDIISRLDPEQSDVLYQRAQLEYALRGRVAEAETLFTDWIAREEEYTRREEEDENRQEELLRDCYIHVITSFIELAPGQTYDAELVRRWVEIYLALFSPLGGYQSDLALADTVREENLSDMVVRVYTSLLETDPYLNHGWTVLAASQYAIGQYEDALESAEFALAVNPHDWDALLTKAHCFYTTDRSEEALSLFSQYIENTNDSSQYLPYAVTLIRVGKGEQAPEYLQKAEKYYSNFTADTEFYAYSCFEIADAYLSLERIDDAHRLIDIALGIYPDNADFRLMKGTLQVADGNIHAALKNFLIYIEAQDDVVEATIHVSVRFMMFGLDSIAIELLNSVERLSKAMSVTDIYPYKAFAYYRLKKFDKFMDYLAKSIKHCPDRTAFVLSDLFPENMNPRDYYNYILKKPPFVS